MSTSENYELFVGPFIMYYINNPQYVAEDLGQSKTDDDLNHVDNVINKLYMNSNFNLFSLDGNEYDEEDEESTPKKNSNTKYDYLDIVIPNYKSKISKFILIFKNDIVAKLANNPTPIKDGDFVKYDFTNFINETIKSKDTQLSVLQKIDNQIKNKRLNNNHLRIIKSFIPFITTPTLKDEYFLYPYYLITKYDIKNLLNMSLDTLNSINIVKSFDKIKQSNKINMVFQSFQVNTTGAHVCIECARNYFINEFISKRKVYDFKTVNNELRSELNQNIPCNSMIYINNDLCRDVKYIESQLNEEHILPAYVVSMPYYYHYITTKSIYRELNPILTDLHNIFLTEKNINSSRSNWRYADIPDENVTNLLRYTNNMDEINKITNEMKLHINNSKFNQKIESRPRKYIDHIFIGTLTTEDGKDQQYIITPRFNDKSYKLLSIYQKDKPTKLENKSLEYNLIKQQGVYVSKEKNRKTDWDVPPGIMISDKQMLSRVRELKDKQKLKDYNKISNTYTNFGIGEVNALWTKPFCLNKFSGACGLFEPRDADKGKVARAMLYMLLVYGGYYINRFDYIRFMMFYSRNSIDMYVKWAKNYPPDDAEKARNKSIYKFQGNYNPFIQILVDKKNNTWKDFNIDLYNDIFLVSGNHTHLPVDNWVEGRGNTPKPQQSTSKSPPATSKSPPATQQSTNPEIDCLKYLK
jgi:endonuclease I